MTLTNKVPNGAVTGVCFHAQSAANNLKDTDDGDEAVSTPTHEGETLRYSGSCRRDPTPDTNGNYPPECE